MQLKCRSEENNSSIRNLLSSIKQKMQLKRRSERKKTIENNNSSMHNVLSNIK